MTPWLTVIIPVHNGAPLLDGALAGIAAQQPDGVEVLIFNSAQDDGAAKAIAECYADRIAIGWHDRPDLSNWNYKANEGVRMARAPHVAVLCHDDFWLPGHLAAVRASLARSPDAVMTVAPSRIADGEGKLLGRWGLPLRAGLVSGQAFGAAQIVQCTVAINAVVFRRDAVIAAGGIDEDLWYTSDWDLYLKLSKAGAVDIRPEVTTAYRVHSGAQTISASRDIADFRRQLETVKERHLAAFTVTGSALDRRASAAVEINCALALAASGQRGKLPGLVSRLLRMGPVQLARLLNETRLFDRMRPRLRLALAGSIG